MLLGINSLPLRTTRVAVRAAASDVAATSSSNDRLRRSLYEVLRVNRNASQSEIKTAYRALAKLYHPDARSRFMDSAIVVSETDGHDCFVEINRAYATLSDPQTRAVYDTNILISESRMRRKTDYCSGRSGYYPTRRWETDQCW